MSLFWHGPGISPTNQINILAMIKAKMLIVTVVMTTAILDSGATKAAIDPNNLYDIDTIHSLSPRIPPWGRSILKK